MRPFVIVDKNKGMVLKSKNFIILIVLVLLINVSLNLWAWFALGWKDQNWSAYGRAFFSLMPILILPLSEKLSHVSFTRVVVWASACAAVGALMFTKKYHPVWHSLSSLLFGLSLHLIVFRSQSEWGKIDAGPELLRSFSFWQGFTVMIAPGIVGLMIDNGIGKNGGYAVLISLIGVLLYLNLKNRKELLSFVNEKTNRVLDEEKIKISSWSMKPLLHGLKSRELRILNAKTIFLSGSITALTVVMPLWSIQNHWSATQAGLILSLIGACSLVSRLALSMVKLNESNSVKILTILMWGAGILLCIWPWVSDFNVAVSLAATFGLVWGAATPISLGLYAWLSRRVEYPSAVWSSRSLCISITALSLPFVVGGAMYYSALQAMWTSVCCGGGIWGLASKLKK